VFVRVSETIAEFLWLLPWSRKFGEC